MTFKLAVDIIFWTLWKTKRTPNKPKWTFHLHFPLLAIFQNFQMVWRLSLLLREKEQWMNDLENFKNVSNQDQRDQMKQLHLPEANSDRGNLIRMGKDEMQKLIIKLIDDKSYQGLAKMLPRLLSNIDKLTDESFFNSDKAVTKPQAIQQLIVASLKLKEEEITTHELKIASFNLNEGLLEAAPQALLQTSIQMRDGKFFNRKSTAMEMVTVILSLISMSFASGTM